jgi:hypothetical protein
VAEKTKCQKVNVNLFTTKLGWIISSTFWGQNPLSYYTLMILNTIYLPYKDGPTTNSQATQKWFHKVKMRNHWLMSNRTTFEELVLTFSLSLSLSLSIYIYNIIFISIFFLESPTHSCIFLCCKSSGYRELTTS